MCQFIIAIALFGSLSLYSRLRAFFGSNVTSSHPACRSSFNAFESTSLRSFRSCRACSKSKALFWYLCHNRAYRLTSHFPIASVISPSPFYLYSRGETTNYLKILFYSLYHRVVKGEQYENTTIPRHLLPKGLCGPPRRCRYRHQAGEYHPVEEMKQILFFDLETSTLLPFLPEARIYCIGVRINNEEYLFLHEDEKYLLEQFWSFLGRFYPHVVLIGYNNFDFDNNYLLCRTLYHNIQCFNMRMKSMDLRKELFGYGFKKGKLDDCTTLLQIPGKLQNGEDVQKLWEEKRFEELGAYCLYDCKIVDILYQRLQQIGWLQ